MKIVAILSLLASGLAPQTQQEAPPPVVHGTVVGVDGTFRRPLPFASIEVVLGDYVRIVRADVHGRYSLTDVPPGPRVLRASYVGHKPVEVEVLVPSSGTLSVELGLAAQPIELRAIRVLADSIHRVPIDERRADDGRRSETLVELRALESNSGMVQSGVGEAVRSIPGNDPRDPTDILLMRGSSADLKLVMLDGAPVYSPFHTGGLLRGFETSALEKASQYVAGAPARFDGGLSYILDMRTRSPRRDRLRTWGSADLLSFAGGIETPIHFRGEPRAGILVVSRALHGGASGFVAEAVSPYGYVDGLLRADLELGPSTSMAVTGFFNREEVAIDIPPSPTTPGIEEAAWGNDVLSVTVRQRGDPLTLDIGLATSAYDARIPIQGVSTGQDPDAPAASPALASGETDRTRFTVDASSPRAGRSYRFGVGADRLRVKYGADIGTERASLVAAEGWTMGAYFDGDQLVAPEFNLRYGVRVDHFLPGGTKGAVRAALLWSLGPDAILSVAGGRFHQMTRLGETEAELTLGDAVQLAAGPLRGADPRSLLNVASADHVALTLDQLVSPEVRVALEGFFKSFRGLGEDGRDQFTTSGMDVRVLRRGDSFTGWVGYSLSWVRQRRPEVARARDYSTLHLLTAGFDGPLAGPFGVDVNMSLGAGLPLTAVPFEDVTTSSSAQIGLAEGASQATAEPILPDRIEDGFLRLDAEIFAEWTRGLGSREVRIRPYLRVLNSLDRRDALFYYFEQWREDSLRALAELPFIPVVGLRWYF